MKIDREGRLNTYTAPGRMNRSEVRPASESLFEQELNQHREENLRLKMQELLEEMDGIQKRLKTNLNINDLMLYKKLVKNFLQEATNRAYSLNQERGRNRRGRTLLITVKTIDQEMEQLIADFMNHAQEPVDILQTLDKIRGMLIDLMV
jgi:uncharacterized protein YaaR (DUF327 family)